MLLFTASDFSDGHISDDKNDSSLGHCCQFLSANSGTEIYGVLRNSRSHTLLHTFHTRKSRYVKDKFHIRSRLETATLRIFKSTSPEIIDFGNNFVCVCVLCIQGIHKRMIWFQKLTRNVFLTLYGHKVHCQQQQLSKFLMRYQQFASHAYCGATGPVSKMPSQQEKAFCVHRFEVSRSAITVQREFRARFRKDAPCRNNKTRWYRQFMETGCLCKGKSTGRPRVSDDDIERVAEAFLRSPRKSVARVSRELDMPKMTVWKVLRKRLCFKPYKMRLVQALTLADTVKRRDFCEEMQLKMDENDFVERLIFCNETTFHISGKVNVHNVRTWGTEQPHAQIEHQRDSPKVNLFCAVSREKEHGQFFFTEPTVTGDSFLDMLENWLLPHLNTNYDD